MTTFNWSVLQMETQVSDGQFSDVVVTAHWSCTAVDGDYSAYVYGSCAIPLDPTDFTPYANLTQQQVLDWCWNNGVNKDATETQLQAQINEMITPQIVVLPLPWSA